MNLMLMMMRRGGVSAVTYRVDERYKLVELLGQGAYGIVMAADDGDTGKAVAIKVIENAFAHIAFTKRTLRELKILRHLHHENILGINSIMTHGGVEGFMHVFVVTDLFETDLGAILKTSQMLTMEQCVFFLYQVLRGVKYFHSAGVVHRDLKPRNLLVNFNCDLKICDFGLSKLILEDRDGFEKVPMTARSMCTRWYRSPEILCDCKDYGKPVDMWSVGCIFAEILTKKPLLPGESNSHQLELTLELTGVPTEDTIRKIGNDKLLELIRETDEDWEEPMNLMEIFLDSLVKLDEDNADRYSILRKLISSTKLLKFDPDDRLTVQQALQHRLLKTFHRDDDEPVRNLIPMGEFEFERRRIDQLCLRELIHREMLRIDLIALTPGFMKDSEVAARYPLLEPGECFGVDRPALSLILMEKPESAERIDNLAEEVIDMLSRADVSAGEEADTDWTGETRNVVSACRLMAGNVAASEGEATTVRVAAAVQRKLEAHPRLKRATDESSAEEEEQEGFCHDGFFSELPLSANLRVLNYLDPTEGEYHTFAAICRATCVATNMQLEYIYLIIRIIRFVVFGPSEDESDDDEEEGEPSESTTTSEGVVS
ncbi:hypothetical protein FOZ60_002762 [Perkinsus olseni]|uniref:Mitogen-activated protein kinase n=1 Tax=Perkinsus olseni TaxID=32597 RepID=A0A7J6NX85_PEROL|nr:hypothetical protein FOZ60_002762 [Perkinsus olseni]